MKRYLQCAEQQRCLSNITKYCACHAKWLSWLIRVTYETLFTMRGATEVTLQHHQILRLPRKMNLENFAEISPKQLKRHLQCGTGPTMIRAWNRQSATRLATEVTFRARHEHFLLKNTTFRAPAIIPNFTKCCACHEKWHCNFIGPRTYETLFTLRGATEVTFQHHQILRLLHKMGLMIDPRDIWNVAYNARSNRGVSPTSPNNAPATQNDSHDWSASHMKRYLQCAEQQRCLSNITKYCACQAKWTF